MKLIISILLLTISLASFAQHNKNTDAMPELTLGIGISFQKFNGINERIANFPKYKQLSDHTGTLQLGFRKEQHRFISELNLIAGSSLSGNRSKKSSVAKFYGIGAGIGYDLLQSEKILLYPLAGLGYQKYQARFYQDNSSVPFDGLLESPSSQSQLQSLDFKNSFFTYRLGFGVAVKSARHCSIGLSAGYTGSFKSHAWKSNQDQALANSPEDKLSQYQVSIILGSQPSSMMMKH